MTKDFGQSKHLYLPPALALVLTVMGVNISSFCPSAYCYPVLGNSGVLAQTPDEGKATADRLLEQGLAAYNNGQFPEAVASLQKAREIYHKIGALQQEWQVVGNLGLAYQQMGEASRALELFQEQLNIAQQLNNIVNVGLSLLNLGGGYMTAGDQNQALVYSKKGLEIARELKTGELRDLAIQLENIAISQIIISYQLLQDWTQALAWVEEDLAIARSLADASRTGEDLYQMASIYEEIDDLLAAESTWQQSLNIAIDANQPILQAQSLRSLSTLYLSLGDFGKSREYAEQTLTLVRQLKTPETTSRQLSRIEQNFLAELESQALSVLASVYLFTGDGSQGLQYLQEKLALAKNSQKPTVIADAISELGLAYYLAGDYQQAEALLTEALETYKDNNEAPISQELNRQILGNMGFVLGQVKLALGDRETAIAYARENLAIARESENVSGEASALVNLGWTLWQTGNLPEAETTLREAIKKFAPIRAKLSAEPEKQRGFFDISYYDAYELLQQVLIAGDRPLEALQVAEEGRARTFVELLAARVAPNQPEISPPTIEELQKIARLQNATLVEYSIIYDALQPILPNRIGGGQPNLEAELFIWVIKPSGEITFRRSDLKASRQKSGMSLTELVRLSRWEMGVRGRPIVGIQPRQITPANSEARSDQNKLQKLHDILIAPIADLLPNNPSERIVFIPQGSLFLVPFPALQDAAGNYLISQHTILAAPAMQALALTSGARQGSGGVLVAGNPIMPAVGNPPLQLSPLPGAEAEARSIAGILNTTALISGAATKQAILQQLPGARIVHLATHGLLDGVGEGVPGAIALAPSGGDSGLLTAGEILDLRLNAELVVLSACDTGRGRITGDGVVGLSQSLLTAGAKSVIVSLWSVPDAPTAELMAEFYRHWQQNPDKAQALRSAMLAVMKSHPEPIDWAGFTLMGAAE